MNNLDIENFLKNIESDLSEAMGLVSNLEDYQWGYYDEKKLIFNEKKKFDEIVLEDYIKKSILKVQFILEHLKLNSLLEDFNTQINGFDNKLIQFEHIPYVGVLVNPVVGVIQNYVDAITCILPNTQLEDKKVIEDIELLERILKGTSKLIKDRGMIPEKEADVQKEVYNTLIHVFPDTLREFQIPKELTNYKPDIGVRSLKCAIEYKFVDNETECKKFIGGIYEDMMAYEGSKDWVNFYAIIYMTDNFTTQAQVDSQLKTSKSKENWKVFLLFGKGERKRKTTANKK